MRNLLALALNPDLSSAQFLKLEEDAIRANMSSIARRSELAMLKEQLRYDSELKAAQYRQEMADREYKFCMELYHKSAEDPEEIMG